MTRDSYACLKIAGYNSRWLEMAKYGWVLIGLEIAGENYGWYCRCMWITGYVEISLKVQKAVETTFEVQTIFNL